MKQKIFNIIQIGDKSNRISRFFDIFITVTIFLQYCGYFPYASCYADLSSVPAQRQI